MQKWTLKEISRSICLNYCNAFLLKRVYVCIVLKKVSMICSFNSGPTVTYGEYMSILDYTCVHVCVCNAIV